MKIDFHIHTESNPNFDRPFTFSENFFWEYLQSNGFDAAAITNHNLFNKAQYVHLRADPRSKNCFIFPGIEISLGSGHILVIADSAEENLDYLDQISNKIHSQENGSQYHMSIAEFNSTFCGKHFLLIPHYRKDPSIPLSVITQITDTIFVGEVDSPKKFFALQKIQDLTPVYFSDIRIDESLKSEDFQEKSRFTYLDCAKPVFSSIELALRNRNSVALTRTKLPDVFDILNGEATASTGINVLLGRRSSGKTFTLDHIAEKNTGSVLYIKQFAISKECTDTTFFDEAKNDALPVVLGYFKELNAIFDVIDHSNVLTTESALSDYVSTLRESANRKLHDSFSDAPLFNYSPFAMIDAEPMKKLVNAVEELINASSPEKEDIEKVIKRTDLIALYKIFLEKEKKLYRSSKIIFLANQSMKLVSDALGIKSSAVQIKSVSFYDLLKARYLRFKFDNLLDHWKKEVRFTSSVTNKFSKVISIYRQTNKTKLKSLLGVPKGGQVDYLISDSPLTSYLESKEDKSIKDALGDYRYRLYFDYDVEIMNDTGHPVSGGQKAEYILLNKLYGYQRYDMVLIDEMESSFDNPFLNGDIVNLIHDISACATVFISTHNNNLGVSLDPDYYIFHQVDNNGREPSFLHFCGKSSDIVLKDAGGKQANLSDVLIETMEASTNAYIKRKGKYETSKN